MEYLLWSKSVKKTMSKQVKFAAFIDKMLFEWGIHHLHIGGATPSSKKRIRATSASLPLVP